jgi:hypothetical protein
MLDLLLEHHPHGPFPKLRRISICSVNDSILSKFGVSGKAGTVQADVRR